jgi:hypothetical protein
MTIDSFCRRFAASLAKASEEDFAAAAAGEIAGFFGTEPHEVGLFQIDSSGRFAIFRWPPQRLDSLITIPIKSFASSLISATARDRRATVDNAFAGTRHLFIYEQALAEKEQRLTVQKIMSAPVVAGGQLAWIIQVTRKGLTAEEAGPDFTATDLEHLERISATFADIAPTAARGRSVPHSV